MGVKHPQLLFKNLNDVTRAETSTYEVMFLSFIHVSSHLPNTFLAL